MLFIKFAENLNRDLNLTPGAKLQKLRLHPWLERSFLSQVINNEVADVTTVCYRFKGGARLKFGDVITAVASLAVVYMLLDFVLLGVVITVNSYWAPDIATVVSVLVASLIVGYVFVGKIKEESRIGAIGRIVVLSTVVLTFYTMALFTNPYGGALIEETLESMFSTSGWTTMDWVVYSQLLMVMIVALNVVFDLVFGFVGLYAGSILRKPKKS